MKKDKEFEYVRSLVLRMVAFAIAKMIGTKQLDPAMIRTKEEMRQVINNLGRTDHCAFEMYINRTDSKIKSIRACIEHNDTESAIVLLSTLVENEINSLIRIMLILRGFTHNTITDAIKGTDLKTKIEVMLPLVGLAVPDRIRQITYESQRLRNDVVHFKARPERSTDIGVQKGDESIRKKTNEFFERNPVAEIEKVIAPFVDNSVSLCEELQQAYFLIENYLS